MRSNARRSRLEALAVADRPLGAVIATGMTTRGLVGTLFAIAGPCAVIKRATGRLEEDCPRLTVAVAKIKERDKVQSKIADRAEKRTTIVRGKYILFM
jgi:hypothetical protein